MYTLMHEHIYLDLSGIKNDSDCLLDDFDAMVDEFISLKSFGVSRICDVTNIGIGRNIDYVEKTEQATGIEIISCTGCYKEPFLPQFMYELNAKQVADIFIKEIQVGIDESTRKAKLIGEVGTSLNKVTDVELKLLQASSIAANETGCWITTHTSLGTKGLEQVDILKSQGVDLSKVILGHVDLANDLDYCLRLLDLGVNVEFDTIGKINYLSDERRIEMLCTLLSRSYQDQIFISMDITRKSHLKRNGGIGYDYLFTNFIPQLKQNDVNQHTIDAILCDNPKRVLN